jgi:hypothetical protein
VKNGPSIYSAVCRFGEYLLVDCDVGSRLWESPSALPGPSELTPHPDAVPPDALARLARLASHVLVLFVNYRDPTLNATALSSSSHNVSCHPAPHT